MPGLEPHRPSHDVRGERRHQRAPRRIDAAVGAVMAHNRAAALAEVVRDSIYI